MNSVDDIQAAEHKVEELQTALDSVQSGLHRAEGIAKAAQDTSRVAKAIAVASTVIFVLAVVALRRRFAGSTEATH